jgi:hypothetical protein
VKIAQAILQKAHLIMVSVVLRDLDVDPLIRGAVSFVLVARRKLTVRMLRARYQLMSLLRLMVL